MTEWTRNTFLKIVGASLASLFGARARAQAAKPGPVSNKRKTRYMMAVLTNAVPGREAEFNDWYTNRHIHDVVKVPGVNAAQRFHLAETSGLEAPKFKYFAIYELETADLGGTIGELLRRNGTPALPLSDAMDLDAYFAVYEAITPQVTA